MNHMVRTYNKDFKCVYQSFHQTAETAYAEYVRNIECIKKMLPHGEEYTVARYNDGTLMTFETIKK